MFLHPEWEELAEAVSCKYDKAAKHQTVWLPDDAEVAEPELTIRYAERIL
ncbi:MAG: hypothetical protein IKQ62_09425 [Bacteroidaceae bacterium]|nr:hypothetical protein [Bacteroidaceae bacterium]